MMRIPMEDFHEAVKEAHRICRERPHMVPVVSDGLVYTGDSETIPLPQEGINAEDYVLGMEALGASFWLYDDQGNLRLMLPIGLPRLDAPENWRQRAHALQRVFQSDRYREIADFLLERGDQTIPMNSKGSFA